MQITQAQLRRATVPFSGRTWPFDARSAHPMDTYPDSADWEDNYGQHYWGKVDVLYLFLDTDTEHTGVYGPLMADQARVLRGELLDWLVGKDARDIVKLHDQMQRKNRHGRSGLMMTAISAVDLALWDLAGKRLGEPVFRLLGGPTRDRIPAYASLLGHDVEPANASATAAKYKEAGWLAQKWFFRFGPRHGQAGIEKNLATAEAVREAVGEHYPIMFDAFMGWDLPYAVEMCRVLESVSPRWMEEPLLPEDVSGYATLKQSTRVPIAFGEHVYGRRQVQPLLERGVMDVVQTDPDWTGGLTELQAICHLAASHGKTVAPHGHTILPALHVAAAQPPSVVPMVEFLDLLQPQKQAALATKIEVDDGHVALPEQPGLGMDLVDAKWSIWTDV